MLAAPLLIVTGPSGAGKSTVSRLVAAALRRSVHVRMDDFAGFAVSGWLEPWRPEAAHQNRVLGGAVLAAATEFAQGGFTAVIDGTVLPDALDELVAAFRSRPVPLHYVVLRCDLATCRHRVLSRDSTAPIDPDRFEELHARFDPVDRRDRHAIEAADGPGETAAAVLAEFGAGALAAHSRPRA